ncbi:hypothetical protein PTKIN_Ptkin09bG0227100 [Pterospermum kingtungense]
MLSKSSLLFEFGLGFQVACLLPLDLPAHPNMSEEYKKAVEKAKRKLRGLIAEKNCAPIMP